MLSTKYSDSVERMLVQVADRSGKDSIGFWRDSCTKLQDMGVTNGSLIQVTGIVRTGINTLNSTQR